MFAHESPVRSETAQSSDRTFGLVFAAFFAVLGLWPLVRGEVPRFWSLGLSAAFLALALVRPRLLAPLNRLWTLIGLVLHRVVNPVIMAILLYGVFTPFGWLLRSMGKDLLRLRYDPAASSYWIERRPPGPAPETMANQF